MIVVPFEPNHYVEAINSPHVIGDAYEAGVIYHDRGPAFTGLIDGKVAACAGVATFWPGMGEAWAVVTELGRQHRREVHRAVKTIFGSIVRDGGYHRIQADVVANFAVGRRWAEHLGFEFESFMRKYGPRGEDYVRYRILPSEE